MWISDATASEAWLSLGLFGIGMSALLIALTFRLISRTPTTAAPRAA
jgi:hypothetical protein